MRIPIDKYYVDEKRELLMIELKVLLSLDKAYTLSVSFDCDLTSLHGAYRSSYTDATGKKGETTSIISFQLVSAPNAWHASVSVYEFVCLQAESDNTQ